MAGGLALVGCAVAPGAWAVDAASDTQQIYVLARDVAPGTDLTAEGVLTLVASHPGSGSYVKEGDLPQEAVATRSMVAGELLPTAGVGRASDVSLRSVVLTVAGGLPATTGTGDTVELWRLPTVQENSRVPSAQGASADQAQGSTPVKAQSVASGLVVVTVKESGSSLIGAATTTVEVLVPPESLEQVLTAVGSGAPLVLVPTGQGT
ncbi:hypothetical protein JJJ15_02910 [Actinomyces sp. HMT897]|nr:hypothetical protein JJJ15_02910 [Actinomyces sp. HMT897]